MQGRWKDKEKHIARDKFKSVQKKLYSEVDHSVHNAKNIKHIGSETFVYGINTKDRSLLYYMVDSKKSAQKMVHRQTRASVRNWIAKRDFEAERKIPCYERSLSWFLI